MSEESIEALAKCVVALEQQNRRLKRVGIAVVMLGASLVLMGQARPPEGMRVSRLELIDATGMTRAMLAMNYASNAAGTGPEFSLGAPSLVFYNRDGSTSAGISADPSDQRPSVFVMAPAGGMAFLSAYSGGGASLSLNSTNASVVIPGAFLTVGGSSGAGPLFLGDGVAWRAPAQE
jgi:hypothetical protein